MAGGRQLSGSEGSLRCPTLSWHQTRTTGSHGLLTSLRREKLSCCAIGSATCPRQILTIGKSSLVWGCFLELMGIAAAQNGFAVENEIFPQGEDGPVAVSTFRPGSRPDPLFAEVMKRRSCKRPFEDTPVPGNLVADLSGFATIVDQPEPVAALRKLTLDAFMVEVLTPAHHARKR